MSKPSSSRWGPTFCFLGPNTKDMFVQWEHTVDQEKLAKFLNACRSHDLEFVREVLQKKELPVWASNKRGVTGLHCAAARGDLEMVNLLFEMKCCPNFLDNSGASPLVTLVAQRRLTEEEILPTFQSFVEGGSFLSDVAEGVGSPMHILAERNFPRAIRLCADYFGLVSERNNNGETPLHVAVKRGSHAAIEALLDCEADPSLCTPSGETPADLLSLPSAKKHLLSSALLESLEEGGRKGREARLQQLEEDVKSSVGEAEEGRDDEEEQDHIEAPSKWQEMSGGSNSSNSPKDLCSREASSPPPQAPRCAPLAQPSVDGKSACEKMESSRLLEGQSACEQNSPSSIPQYERGAGGSGVQGSGRGSSSIGSSASRSSFKGVGGSEGGQDRPSPRSPKFETTPRKSVKPEVQRLRRKVKEPLSPSLGRRKASRTKFEDISEERCPRERLPRASEEEGSSGSSQWSSSPSAFGGTGSLSGKTAVERLRGEEGGERSPDYSSSSRSSGGRREKGKRRGARRVRREASWSSDEEESEWEGIGTGVLGRRIMEKLDHNLRKMKEDVELLLL